MTVPDATPVDPLAVEFSRLHDADAIFQWTPCRPTCGLCPCSGVPGFTDEAKRVLAQRDARIRAEALREAAVLRARIAELCDRAESNPLRWGGSMVLFARTIRSALRSETTLDGVLAEVREERARQDAHWGEQNHPDGTGPWVQPEFYPHRAENMAALAKRRTDRAAKDGKSTYEQILTEEYLEAIAEDDPTALREELLQVAAVAVAWVEKLDREAAAEYAGSDL